MGGGVSCVVVKIVNDLDDDIKKGVAHVAM